MSLAILRAHLSYWYFEHFSAMLPLLRTFPLIVTFIRACPLAAPSSLVQSLKFSERPGIVPPEVLSLNVGSRALSPKMIKSLIDIQMRRIKHFFSLHQGPGNYQHLCCQLHSHFGLDSLLTCSSLKHFCKICSESVIPG
jgi:hypothetical protein